MMAARPIGEDMRDEMRDDRRHLPSLVRQALRNDGLILAVIVFVLLMVAVF